MSIKDIIEGKREWRAHMARVKALPEDYRIVYGEMQNYLFKVGISMEADWQSAFSGILELFEEGAALGKGVLDVTGNDVAAFCDGIMENTKTGESYLGKSDRIAGEAVEKALRKSKN